MYQAFYADAVNVKQDDVKYSVILSSDRSQPAMRIATEKEYIYITKQQAMEFFGLVEAEAKPMADETIIAKPAVYDWDIFFLKDEHARAVKHDQVEAATKEQAIEEFRKYLGDMPYIVGITQRDPILDN